MQIWERYMSAHTDIHVHIHISRYSDTHTRNSKWKLFKQPMKPKPNKVS